MGSVLLARSGTSQLKVMSVGHAGLHIETEGGTILCDPWLYPAYFASWFPFPDNSGLDWERLGQCDYLYVSHLHRDHFDPLNLSRNVRKSTTVLLPEFPIDELEVALRSLGFTTFERIPHNVPVELDGLRVMISALVAPSDGPLGDSALAVDDGTAVILNQNDAHPFDFAPLEAFARGNAFDGHFLQYSGAIWWPVVYELAEATKAAIGAEKRRNGMARALRYIEQLGASFVFPNAGPPCFLDQELRSLNDTDRDDANIFPDASVFLEFLADHGHCEGRLLIPGSTADLRGGTDGGGSTCAVTHPFPLAEVEAIFADKQRYLDRYGDRQRSVIASQRASWAAPEMDVLAELKSWFEPLLDRAVHIRAGVGGPVELLVVGDGAAPAGSDRRGDLSIVIDFAAGVVRPGRDVDVLCRHRFRVGRSLVERLIADHEIDWSNSLFLSMRFSAQRTGPYNEFLYTFLKCLSLPRIEYAERWYSSREDSAEDTVIGDWCVQRRCPHLRADLSRFGVIDEETLTCRMHGWQWDLESGACLTSAGHPLRSRRVRAELAAASVPVESVPAGSVPVVAVPAGSVPIVAVPAGSVPVVAVPAGSVPVVAVPAGSVPEP